MENLNKKTLNLRDGDWEYLTSIYQNRGVATSFIVRKIVSDFVDRLRAKEGQATLPTIEDEV